MNCWKIALLYITGDQLSPEFDVVLATSVITATENPMMLADKVLGRISEQVEKPCVRPLDNTVLRHNKNRDGSLNGLKIRFQLPNPAFCSLKLCERFL
jgi:hypothetical protein